MKNNNSLRLTMIIILLGVSFYTAHSQVIGNTDNGPAPTEAKPSDISTGASKGDVNLFNGEYNRSYSLGSVGTPSGLGYSVSMDYSTSGIIGDNVPFTSGIPYGQGWNVSVPSITVSTTDFHNYTQSELCSAENCSPGTGDPLFPNNCVSFQYSDLLDEGQLFTIQPVLNIPGVAHGRMVYKYYGTLGGDAGVIISGPIFVLHTFETYIEAIFDGVAWHVRLSDGTIYHFEVAQANIVAPNNQRLPWSAQSPDEVYTSITPKAEILGWYVTRITNTNHPNGESIQFEYNTFGSFNFYQEYDQEALKLLSQFYFTSSVVSKASSPTNDQDPFLNYIVSLNEE
jgi:hypothetical protein